jgi:hypothetical protein
MAQLQASTVAGTLTTTGNVGINTTSVSTRLRVNNSSTQYLIYQSDGNLELYTPESQTGYVRLGAAYSLNGVYGSNGFNYIVEPAFNHTFRAQGTALMTITGGGNVGIGLTNPFSTLHVRTSANEGTIAVGNVIYPGLLYANAGSGEFRIDNRGSFSSGYITFFPNGQQTTLGTEAMRITSGGNVGIGTATPIAKFHVNNSGGTGNPFYVNTGNSGNTTLFEHTGASTPVPFTLTKSGFSGAALNYGLLYLHMNDGTAGNGSNLYFTLNDSIGNQHEYGGLGATIRSNTNGVEQGDLFFMTSDNGTTRSEKMRIISNGNVGIGTISPPSLLTVNGASTGTVPLVDLLASGTGLYQRGVRILNKDMAANSSLMGYAVGRSDDTRNQGQMVFNFIGAGSTSNYLEFGLFAVDNVLNIAGTGNVGIGVTNPGAKLEINDSTGYFRIWGNSTGDFQAPALAPHIATGDFSIYSGVVGSGTFRMVVKNGGNVGIGVTNPSAKLHIDSGDTGATAYALRTDAASLDYALYVSSSGNVAIGGLVPAAALNHKLVVFSGSIALRGPNDANFSYRLNDTAGTNRNALYVSSSNYLNVGNAAFAGLQLFHTGSAPALNDGSAITNYYGTDERYYLAEPNKWLAVRINNVNYVMPMYEA